jgi:hypothetical protein
MSYFKLGEECILQSECNPELNGECVVLKVFRTHGRTQYSNGVIRIESGYGYITTIECPDDMRWDESALRKKHKPSTESLSTMIEELNKVKV